METRQISWEEDTQDQGVQAALGQRVVKAHRRHRFAMVLPVRVTEDA